jgi:death-on-curing protein
VTNDEATEHTATLLDGNKRAAWAAAWTFLYINGFELGDFDVDDAEEFVNAVATDENMPIDYIASKLSSYAVSSS